MTEPCAIPGMPEIVRIIGWKVNPKKGIPRGVKSRIPFEECIAYEPTSGCWLWAGSLTPDGYPRLGFEPSSKDRLAHRYSYRQFRGEIPNGCDLHHSCKVRSCVNPDHLVPIPHVEHVAVDTALRNGIEKCRHGHIYTPENTYLDSHGWRSCRACRKDAEIQRRNRKEAQR